MTIPGPPQPNSVPSVPIDPQAGAPVPAGKPSSAIAITALVVGGVAFLSGLAPVWGLIVGIVAVALGVLAIVRKQRTVFALTGLGLGAVAGLTSLITTVALVSGIGSVRESDVALAPIATSTASSAPAATAKPIATAAPTATPTPTPTVAPAPPKPVETVGQSNATRKAQSYLKFTAFSRSGLIDQLVYEGFSTEDATYGADAVGADWSAQAAAKAQSYLDLTAFSRDGLIEQLTYEGFSPEEAEYGVTAVGY
jgi:hypothetical protein